jgi:hypothetical protein
MSIGIMTNYFNRAKSALKKKNKNIDHRGLNTKKNYSSFWMDDEWDNTNKFSGLSSEYSSKSSDLVKLIKLSNYRKAITNFVKIVTKKDIPVMWAGSDSFTDGKAINISTNIKDTNFDVTVGLALHEASHIVLSDFELVKQVAQAKQPAVSDLCNKYSHVQSTVSVASFIRQLLNWVEDRRIDHYIFSTSPGYKAYYHKLYDHYWNHKDIIKAFLSDEYSKPTADNYMFHIINMINPAFEVKALPRLDEIVELVDLRNISRLKSTQEALDVAVAITDIVYSCIEKEIEDQKKALEDKQNGSNEDENSTPSAGSQNGGDTGDDANEDDDDDNGDDENDNESSTPLTTSEINAIRRAFEAQKRFLDGSVDKKAATKKLQRELDNAANQTVDVQTIGDATIGMRSSLIYDLTKDGKIVSFYALNEEHARLEELRRNMTWNDPGYEPNRKRCDELHQEAEAIVPRDVLRLSSYLSEDCQYARAISDGLDMGGLLGKKLQLHNESRERVDNRLRQGKIDNRRLAHTGYDIENVFKQIHIDKYKKGNIHISIDGSGSMNGSKWAATIQMTAAIAKAATYTQNINVQVSVRITTSVSRGDVPTTMLIYDSRRNKINQLVCAFKLISPLSMTPEGLCFESMYKKNYFVPSTSEMDSYLLNISDGEPGCTGYGGSSAVNHTRNIINKIKNDLNISVLSFFIQKGSSSENTTAEERAEQYASMVNGFNHSYSGRAFRNMYGRDATVVDNNNAIQIARELNKKFLTK